MHTVKMSPFNDLFTQLLLTNFTTEYIYMHIYIHIYSTEYIYITGELILNFWSLLEKNTTFLHKLYYLKARYSLCTY